MRISNKSQTKSQKMKICAHILCDHRLDKKRLLKTRIYKTDNTEIILSYSTRNRFKRAKMIIITYRGDKAPIVNSCIILSAPVSLKNMKSIAAQPILNIKNFRSARRGLIFLNLLSIISFATGK